ncbi:MAG TPA: phosphatase PAP2 family protein [Burkholderiaceae bacterium]|nr:phosphatase PAP2 family protein [Burkholderiaceae bacterium]
MLQGIGREIVTLDDRVLLWLNQFLHRWPPLDEFAAWLLNAYLFKFGPIVLVICALWFARSAQQARRRQQLLECVLTGVAALFVGRALALALPYRLRPVARPDLDFIPGVEVGARTWSSFPSDHAVLAFALAVSLFRISPRIGLWAAFHATVFICLPRLYFGYHHPSDLLGGALIGIALALAASRWPTRHTVTAKLAQTESVRPGLFYTTGFVVLFEFTEMFDSVRVLARAFYRSLHQFIA